VRMLLLPLALLLVLTVPGIDCGPSVRVDGRWAVVSTDNETGAKTYCFAVWVSAVVGWAVVGALLSAGALYVGGGIGYASTGGQKKDSSGASMLTSHPHAAHWMRLRGLVLDGVAYSRRRVAGDRGAYVAVASAAEPAAAPATAAVVFAKGDSVEYLSSKDDWKLTVVTSVNTKKRTVDTKVKPGIKDMSRLRAVHVVQSKTGGTVDKKAQAKERAKFETEKKKVRAEKEKVKLLSKGAKKDKAAAQEAMAAAEKAAAAAASAAKEGGGGRVKSRPEDRHKYTGPARAAGGKDDVWIKADRTEAKDAGLL